MAFSDWAASVRASLVLAPALFLSACAGKTVEFGGDPQLSVVESDTLPMPTRADSVEGGRPYYIGPFDKLSISIFGIEEFEEREIQVDSSGEISFPLAGVMQVGGKTPAEVSAMIAQRLSSAYVRDPQVTVNLKETINRVVTVDGQVAKPGAYPVVGRMSLIRAVAIAGSTTEFAKLDDVVVFREVAGKRYAGLYNLKAIREGAYADPEVFANDVIVVGDSPARRMFRDILQAAPLLTTPLVYLLQ